MSDKPLHVRVAEALGDRPEISWAVMNREETGIFIDFDRKDEANEWLDDHAIRASDHTKREGLHVVRREHFRRYDTDWSATGPLIERYDLAVGPTYYGLGELTPWTATTGTREDRDGSIWARAETPALAICHLIIALSETGKLK